MKGQSLLSMRETVPFNKKGKFMKKSIFVMAVLSLWISIPAFSEEKTEANLPMQGMEKMGCSMKEKTQMVATDEGGVFVLAGNKLLKYDADLNLVKETEMKMPFGPMGGKQCPMTGKKMANHDFAPEAVQEKTA